MTSKGLVLVTGINGFIAAHTAEAFLKAGFSVRGTARSKSSTEALVNTLAEYADQLEIVEVPDITVPGAFDTTVKGVDHIAHLAAPVSFSFTDPDPVIRTTILSTTGILDSALTEPRIQSVSLMSSAVAVRSPKEGPYTFTDADWNTVALDTVKAQGKQTPGVIIYSASKVASEQAFWKFREEKKPSFSMTAVNPSYVVGAPLVKPTNPDEISMTIKFVYSALTGEPVETSGLFGLPAVIDVRDVARVVVFSAEHFNIANGKRYVLSTGLIPQQAVVDILREAYPERRNIIQAGTPGQGYVPGYKFQEIAYDTSPAVRDTGKEWIPLNETVLFTAKAFEGLL